LDLIVLDTSAVVAILRDEADGATLRASLDAYPKRTMCDVNVLELSIVMLSRLGPDGAALSERFLREYAVERAPFDQGASEEAFKAYHRFGKGRGHPAQLNLGDCAAYATAQLRRAPLLFKGEDFALTDVRRPAQ
jgi:ribonuclease VapC